MSEKVEFHDVEVKHETDKALLVDIEGEEVWIPKSVIDDDSEVYKSGTEGTLIIPEWFSKKNGLS